MNKMEINRKYPKWNKYHEVFVLRDNYIGLSACKKVFPIHLIFVSIVENSPPVYSPQLFHCIVVVDCAGLAKTHYTEGFSWTLYAIIFYAMIYAVPRRAATKCSI